MGRFFPTWYAPSLQEIDFNALKKQGIDTIFCDLDNTLVAYNQATPTEASKGFLEYLKNAGFKVYLVSNNHEERVSLFCHDLNIPYIADAKKPFTKRLRSYIKQENLNPETCVIIGDQIITDIGFANGVHIRSILVEPICDKDLLVTRFNRTIDKRIRHHNLKHHNYQKVGEKDER